MFRPSLDLFGEPRLSGKPFNGLKNLRGNLHSLAPKYYLVPVSFISAPLVFHDMEYYYFEFYAAYQYWYPYEADVQIAMRAALQDYSAAGVEENVTFSRV